jgi:hypothetical protein
LAGRRGKDNLDGGWGFHYDTPEKELRADFDEMLANAVKLI